MINKREWIEFGKMWTNMVKSDIPFMDDDYINLNFDRFEKYPYKTIKDVYFRDYLGIEEYEDITLELDENILDKLYKISDNEDITVDELVMRLLKDMIERMENELP